MPRRRPRGTALWKVQRRTHDRIHTLMKGRAHPPPLAMLGCSYKQLLDHLGDVTDSVTIDHIIPISRYDLANPVDVMRAFNWRNTQLLPYMENYTKGRSLPCNDTLLELKSVWPDAWWGWENECWLA